jgi:GNAT superfamily N-acetyltransferase
MTPVIEIKQLSECPEHLEAVGTWIWQEWWSRRHDTPEVVFQLLRTHTRRDRVPFTVLALVDGVPVGGCCVIENDCPHRPQYTPWVAAVFVKPDRRRQGFASLVLQETAKIASRAGIEALYIDCLAETAPVYEKNGWVIYEHEVGDKDSVVMRRVLAPAG